MNSEFTNFEYIPIPPKPYHPVRALKPDRPASYTSFNFPTKNHTLLLIEKHGSGRIIFACSKFYRDILVYPGKIVMRIGNPSNEHIKIENLAGKMESSIEYETMVRYSLKIPDIKSYSKDEFVSETHLTAINIGAINDEFVIQPPSPLHRALMSFPSHTFYYKDKQSTSQEYKIDTLQRYKSFIDSFCQTFDVTSYTESGTFIAGHESEEEIAEIVKQNKKCLLIISLSNGYLPERWIKICGKLDLIVKHGMEVLFVLDGFDSEFLSKNMPKRFNWYGAQASAQFFLPEIFPEPLPILPSAANSIEEIVSIGTSLTSVISNLNENPRFKKKKGLFDFELSKEPKDLLDAIRELHPLLNLFLASTFVKEFVLNLTLNSYLIDTVGYVKFNFWFQGVWSEIVWRSWYLETEKNDTFLMILIRALFYLLRSKFKMFSENPMDLEKVPDPQRNPPAYSTVSTIFASSKQTTSRQIHVADAANLKIHDVRRVFDSTFSYFDRELCNSVLRYLPVLFFGPSLFTAGIYNSSDQKLLLDYSKSQPEKITVADNELLDTALIVNLHHVNPRSKWLKFDIQLSLPPTPVVNKARGILQADYVGRKKMIGALIESDVSKAPKFYLNILKKKCQTTKSISAPHFTDSDFESVYRTLICETFAVRNFTLETNCEHWIVFELATDGEFFTTPIEISVFNV